MSGTSEVCSAAEVSRVPRVLDGFVDDELYDAKEVASFLGRDERFVRKLEEKRRIRRAQGLGRRLLFLGSEVKRFVRLMRGEGTTHA